MPYILEPEIAGGWGEGTVADTSCHPPKVSKLTYEFEGWQGDDLLAAFPCFIVSRRLAGLIENATLIGYTLAPVAITKSELFMDLHPDRELPAFKWLQMDGSAGADDFFIDTRRRPVVSEAAFNIITQTNINHCEINKYRL